MLHHRTTDPAVRSRHIADRIEKEESLHRLMLGENFLWFEKWLEVYPEILKEMSLLVDVS